MAPIAAGIDIGGTQLRVALIDADGTILTRAATPTDAAGGPAAVVAQIVALMQQVTEGGSRTVIGAGVSSPGPLDTTRGIALGVPTLAGWVDVPIRRWIEDALKLPVQLENDGIAAAIGEWRFGAGRGVDNLVYVTVSTGIGGGVIVDGRPLHGDRGLAGHVGHMTIVPDGRLCACGNRGCWEAYASGTALALAAEPLFKPATGAQTAGKVDARAVFAAARAGDTRAIELVAAEADWLGIGVANLLHLYSPQLVIIGGGLSANFAELATGIGGRVQRSAMPAFRSARIVPAALGENSGLLGAAALILPWH
jgi:glucokinase